MAVKIGKLPGKIVEVEYNGPDGMTIDAALEASGIGDVNGFDVRVNGEEANLNDTVQNGDMVIFAKRVKGN